MGCRSETGEPTDRGKYEYIPRSPRTATKVHKQEKYKAIEEDLDEEIEEALRRHEEETTNDRSPREH